MHTCFVSPVQVIAFDPEGSILAEPEEMNIDGSGTAYQVIRSFVFNIDKALVHMYTARLYGCMVLAFYIRWLVIWV